MFVGNQYKEQEEYFRGLQVSTVASDKWQVMVETPYETKLVSLNYWQVTLIVTSDFDSDKW